MTTAIFSASSQVKTVEEEVLGILSYKNWSIIFFSWRHPLRHSHGWLLLLRVHNKASKKQFFLPGFISQSHHPAISHLSFAVQDSLRPKKEQQTNKILIMSWSYVWSSSSILCSCEHCLVSALDAKTSYFKIVGCSVQKISLNLNPFTSFPK